MYKQCARGINGWVIEHFSPSIYSLLYSTVLLKYEDFNNTNASMVVPIHTRQDMYVSNVANERCD